MKPIILYVGLSIMIIGIITTALGYSEFSRISLAKQSTDAMYDNFKRLNPSLYQQMIQQTSYQQLLSNYNINLALLIGEVALLLVGLGITIYGATKKNLLPTSTTEKP